MARRAGFDLDRCGRSLLADEALMRVDPRILQNARLLAAVADEVPDRLAGWAEMIVSADRELLGLDPLLAASLLVAAQFDPARSETSEEIRARSMVIVVALRGVVDFDATVPESDPLVAGMGRWLHAVGGADERAVAVENLLGQVDAETAATLREVLGSDDDADSPTA